MDLLVIYVITFLAFNAKAQEEEMNQMRLVFFYNSWSVYRPYLGNFEIEDIDPELFTHAIYNSVGLRNDLDLEIRRPDRDLPNYNGKNGFERFNNLRDNNQDLKTMISMDVSIDKLSKVASNQQSRKVFVRNVLQFLTKHKFDGLNIVWLFSSKRNWQTFDYSNFAALFKNLRSTLGGKNLLFSITVKAPQSLSALMSDDLAECFRYPNFINLLTYDLHDKETNTTGLNAPLYAPGNEIGVDDIVRYFLYHNVECEKINLGIAFHGRSYTLRNPSRNYVGAPTIRPGSAGPASSIPGILSYNDICILQSLLDWTVRHDVRSSPYAYWKDQWVSYDDPSSVELKGKYIKSSNLGGATIVNIDDDDFRGLCGDKYPLLGVLKETLESA